MGKPRNPFQALLSQMVASPVTGKVISVIGIVIVVVGVVVMVVVSLTATVTKFETFTVTACNGGTTLIDENHEQVVIHIPEDFTPGDPTIEAGKTYEIVRQRGPYPLVAGTVNREVFEGFAVKVKPTTSHPEWCDM